MDVDERIKNVEARLENNQKIVRELIGVNQELIKKIGDLSLNITNILPAARKMKSGFAEESTKEPFERRLERLEKRVNAMVIAYSPALRKKTAGG